MTCNNLCGHVCCVTEISQLYSLLSFSIESNDLVDGTMKEEDYQFFRENGYVSLGKILTDQEVDHYLNLFDRDRVEGQAFWFDYGNYQTVNYDVLVSSPDFDQLIRHHRVMEPLHRLMGGDLCFSEIGLRHMGVYAGVPKHWSWHRDGRHLMEHPLHTRNIQLIVYLAEVDETTHCFSISPESVDHPILEDNEAQLQRGEICNLYGTAGTAFLCNYSVLHSATVRATKQERKTVQIYYGHRDQPYMANDSLIPTRFWRDHPELEVRCFYGVLNDKTQKYLELAGPEDHPVEQVAKFLYQLDYQYRNNM